MNDNIVPFKGLTKLDLSPEKILRAIADHKPDNVVVIGVKDGKSDLYSSTANMWEVLWLIKKMEHDILSGRFD